MLTRVLAVFLLASFVSGQALAAGKPNPSATQSEAGNRDSDNHPQRGPAPGPLPPGYPPPAYAVPPPPAGRYVVLTEQQKRCGVQRRCELDSREPCPPCW